MSIFSRKSEPTPSTALVPAPPQPLEPDDLARAAPKAGDLEKQVKAQIWTCMSPELAHAAGLSSVAGLVEWVSGITRLSTFQVEALARKMGILDTPVSGLEVIRQALAARLRRPPDWGPSRLNRAPDRGVEQGAENPSSAAHASRLRAFADGGEIDLDTLNEFVREQWGPSSWYDPATDALRKRDTATATGPAPASYTGGSNVPLINERMIVTLKAQLKQLEAAP
jgi:hypothetical protein